MPHLAIRQSGGANIVSIPKAILKTLGLHVGSKLDLSIVDCKIVLTPVVEKQTLEELLAGTPKEKLQLTNEDQEWLEASFVGKEI
ncbi:AbrB/MazE/SpoVT family DNA-binding domain-containing protein [Legionella fairfieldensis]|uniref:AbrB/MazE/SpoVT family DNA-binding domain-containing protein n=1 Tax=Legionella fairfieldensis TaxID=45064 RepID=UPI0004912C5B|nr:AbrB/MazE/SpoVT family DNA-binding domain-containing protein [Legionella fairfieldensis]